MDASKCPRALPSKLHREGASEAVIAKLFLQKASSRDCPPLWRRKGRGLAAKIQGSLVPRASRQTLTIPGSATVRISGLHYHADLYAVKRAFGAQLDLRVCVCVIVAQGS